MKQLISTTIGRLTAPTNSATTAALPRPLRGGFWTRFLGSGLLTLSLWLCPAKAQTTSFSYQGRLTDGATVAEGSYDLQFRLYDAAVGGAPLGAMVELSAIRVQGGLFTVVLDFGGDVFDGSPRWLEVSVRSADGAGAFTQLSPRHELTATPYALFAAKSGSSPTQGNTLDQAYDQGGPGAGAVINADSGTVYITGTGGLSVSGGLSLGVADGATRPPLQITRRTPPPFIVETWTIIDDRSLNSYRSSVDVAGALLSLNNISSGDVHLARGGGDVVLAQGGGNVGIGTADAPAAKLHISGTPGSDGILFPDDTLQTTAAGGSASVPIGTVIDWWRPDDTFPIPDGYLSCDGSVINDPQSPFNGHTLPDLRSRFVMGAYNSLVFGQVGGSYDHSHNIAAGGTTDAVAETTTDASNSNFLVAAPGPVEVAQSGHQHAVPAHSHGLGALDTDTKNHMPAYVALFKIMRVR